MTYTFVSTIRLTHNLGTTLKINGKYFLSAIVSLSILKILNYVTLAICEACTILHCQFIQNIQTTIYLAPHVHGSGNFSGGKVELTSGHNSLDTPPRPVQELDQTRNELVSSLGMTQTSVTSEAPRDGLI